MRNNGPVTQREVPYPDDEVIISRTDLRGLITYVNPTFVTMSGYTEAELLGKPHNILRHPDMPKEAFADLWATVQSGRAWTGIVKNRCKNGDHYWVFADVTPIREGGRTIGYMSIRSRPTRAQVKEAEELYARLRKGLSVAPSLGERLAAAPVAPMLELAALLALVVATLHLAQGDLVGLFDFAAAALIVAARVRLVQPLNDLTRALQTCDLRVSLPVTGPREARELTAAVNVLLGRFRRVISDLGHVSRLLVDESTRLTSTAHQLTGSAQSLAEMGERQRETAASVAAAMTQLSASIEEVATHVKASEAHAGRARTSTEAGEEGGSHITSAMAEIRRATAEMEHAVEAIHDFADQTRLLSLNATIEAARAGQAGRGFVVVASQVRKLAGESADKGNAIAELIRRCMEAVSRGEQTVGKSVDTWRSVRSQLQDLSGMAEDITRATAEQACTSADVAERMERSTVDVSEGAHAGREIAGAAENVAGSAGTVESLSRRLLITVDQFAV